MEGKQPLRDKALVGISGLMPVGKPLGAADIISWDIAESPCVINYINNASMTQYDLWRKKTAEGTVSARHKKNIKKNL